MTTDQVRSPPGTGPDARDDPGVPDSLRAVAGVVAAAVAVGAGELVAAVLPGAASAVLAVGNRTVELAPPALRDAAVGSLGTADKPVLVAGVLVVLALLGAGAGLLYGPRTGLARGVVVCLAVVAGLAVASGPPGTPRGALLTAVVLAGVGLAALHLLLRRALTPAAEATPGQFSAASRRQFLVRAGLLAVGAGAMVTLARSVNRVDVEQLRTALRLASPVKRATGDVGASSFDVPGLSPVITPNRDFYRIDTALSVPRVDSRTWQLAVDGQVGRPLSLSYQQLAAMPQVEADVTLQCVSNEVGGSLVGTARWQGVLLTDLLAAAGADPRADQVVGRSVDGFTAGFPTAVARDGRPAMVALGMNGEPLPVEHGFPARLIVPGLYGYVSATKWLAQIELTTLGAFDAFWIPRGWSKDGPIKIASRIDVPRASASVPPGPVTVAGVAWAPRTGVAAVEVSVDGGGWQGAELAPALSDDTWRQWRLTWTADPGAHELRVRARNRADQVQVEQTAPPRPNGATGYHRVRVTVR